MAVSIEMRKPAVVDNRNMRRRIGAGLLVAAASITLAGVALQVSAGSKAVTQQGPTAEQRIAFVQEEHGYTADRPSAEEPRIEFLQDQGYMPTNQQELARSIVAANSALTPTAEQRMAFVLEEHGYNLAPTADQQLAFLQGEQQISAAQAALAEQRADKPSIGEPRTESLQDQQAFTPTPDQRIAFVLEEHGYNLAELSSPWNKGYKPN
jgi:hypothetical protein